MRSKGTTSKELSYILQESEKSFWRYVHEDPETEAIAIMLRTFPNELVKTKPINRCKTCSPPPGDLCFKDGEGSSLVNKGSRNEDALKQRTLENWENCLEVNLSYQGLGDPYQQENFYKILRRLIRVEKLHLADNFLTDLSSVRLPRCKELNLNKNHLSSFKQLPKIPQIQHLSLTENNIKTLSGLHDLGPSPIQSLTLKRNPCEFQDKYRCRVFSSLPNLKTLDGIPKLPADCSRPETPVKSKMCTVS